MTNVYIRIWLYWLIHYYSFVLWNFENKNSTICALDNNSNVSHIVLNHDNNLISLVTSALLQLCGYFYYYWSLIIQKSHVYDCFNIACFKYVNFHKKSMIRPVEPSKPETLSHYGLTRGLVINTMLSPTRTENSGFVAGYEHLLLIKQKKPNNFLASIFKSNMVPTKERNMIVVCA